MTIRENMRQGKPLTGLLVIDAHCHVGAWANMGIPEYDENGLFKSMEQLGIDAAFISSTIGIGPDFHAGNVHVAKLIKKYPEKFMGYVCINPNYSDAIWNELETYCSIDGMKGIKIHPTMHNYSLDGESYHMVYDFANKNHTLVLSHTWGVEHIQAFDKIAKEYPDAQFILGHSGGVLDALELAVKIVKKHDNLYLDLTVSLQYDGIVEFFCNQVGPDKIVFGSDAPLIDPRYCIGRVTYADISDLFKEKILGLNIQRLIHNRS